MATTFSRVQAFYEKHPDFKFKPNAYHTLHNSVKATFDKVTTQLEPFTYVDFEVDGSTHQIRNYPEYFSNTIDRIIYFFYIKSTKPKLAHRIKRKRITRKVKNPAYSVKPKNQN